MTRTKKTRAIILSALMVLSVFAGTMAIVGSVQAGIDRGGNGNIDYDVPTEQGNVGDGAVIFQGEDDITIVDAEGDTVSPAQFQRAAEAGGETLSLPVAQDAQTGTYTATGIDEGTPVTSGRDNGILNITVDTPRITTFDVNNNQTDVNGGVLTTDQTGATVLVEYNFAQSENIVLTVEDENGLDVTNEFIADSTSLPRSTTALSSSFAGNGDGAATDSINGSFESPNGPNAGPGVNSEGEVAFAIDPSGVDEGEYTFIAEGDDDLAFGDASQSTTVTISADQKATIEFDNGEVTQGVDNTFTVSNSPEGNFHAVLIDSSEFRDGITVSEAQGVFRNVGDVVQTGVLTTSGGASASTNTGTISGGVASGDLDADSTAAFAIVEIDGGNGVGSVESGSLDTSAVTVDVLPADTASGTNDYLSTTSSDTPTVEGSADVNSLISQSIDDDQDFDVVEGDVEITNPSGSYVVGSEVTLNGTTASGIDNVAIYARDQGQYELVTVDGSNTLNVEGDDTFTEEDVVLSDTTGNLGGGILSIPGNYRLGVIDARDADTDNSGAVDNRLNTSAFNGGVSSTSAINVVDTTLSGNFTTYNSQIATEDRTIDVQGVAEGQSGSGVAVVFVGPRGNTDTANIDVESDGTIDEEDIQLNRVSEGTVSAHIISSGRDNQFGDGFANSVSDFLSDSGPNDNGVQDTSGPGTPVQGFQGTGDQVRSLILANTVDDTASDDRIVTETFRLSDGLTTVESVTSPAETNGTVEVIGQTNRKPDDNTITVEMLTQDDNVVASTSTDQWPTSGQYSVNISLEGEGIQPGEYVVEVDDGDNTDRAPVEVVEQVDEEETPTTATPEPDTPTPTPTPTPEPDTPTPTEEPADDTETDTPSTDAGTPGFGIVVALTALIAAALLAVRRTN